MPDRLPARLVVIDVQEKLLAAMPGAPAMLSSVELLLDAANLLGIPVSATEQYPKGLGPTVPSVRAKLPAEPVAKTAFSAAVACGPVADTVVLVGVEAHVCVAQTALEMAATGANVVIPIDAVASRSNLDRDAAFRRLERFHIDLTTAEALVFDWLGDAAHPHFKAISRLVVGRSSVRTRSVGE